VIQYPDNFEIIIEGEGAQVLPRDSSNLVVVGIEAAFQAAGKSVPVLKYHLINRIPYARGLGSSSAAIVAGLIAGNFKNKRKSFELDFFFFLLQN